ncbi:MAG: S-layer homology domain-containing protein [Nitriliruptor sp.]
MPTPCSRLLATLLHRSTAALVTVALALGFALTAPSPAADATTGGTPLMAPSQLTAGEMAAWFRSTSSRVSGYRATVAVETLTRYYAEEGGDEGVAGDLAFAQAVLETGSFSWPGHGQVRANQNNFAGIGACDGGTCTVASFRSARIGVRAQIQHLRAYGDPTVTVASLAHPLESPRFHLVTPKGKAPTWERMGSGNWATDPSYGTKILKLYASMREHAQRNGGGTGGGEVGTFEAYVVPFRDVPLSSTHAPAIAALLARGDIAGCTSSAFCPGRAVSRGQFATLLSRVADLPAGRTTHFTDVAGTHRPGIEAVTTAGFVRGCTRTGFCPTASVTRGQLASIVQAALGLPDAPAPFRDVDPRSTHADAIGALAARGLVSGDADGRFRPSDPVTRGQAASILLAAYPD